MARTQPRSRPVAASTPALHVDRVRAGALVQAAALGRVVDDAVDIARIVPGGARTPSGPPSQSTAPVVVDDAGRVDHRADRRAVRAAPASPNETSWPVGHAVARADADPRRPVPGLPRRPLLGRRRAGEGQPVSVHAMLRTVSLTLAVAAKAAEGSNPEWIAQCSQRGSLPGPYDSHSMLSSSAS